MQKFLSLGKKLLCELLIVAILVSGLPYGGVEALGQMYRESPPKKSNLNTQTELRFGNKPKKGFCDVMDFGRPAETEESPFKDIYLEEQLHKTDNARAPVSGRAALSDKYNEIENKKRSHIDGYARALDIRGALRFAFDNTFASAAPSAAKTDAEKAAERADYLTKSRQFTDLQFSKRLQSAQKDCDSMRGKVAEFGMDAALLSDINKSCAEYQKSLEVWKKEEYAAAEAYYDKELAAAEKSGELEAFLTVRGMARELIELYESNPSVMEAALIDGSVLLLGIIYEEREIFEPREVRFLEEVYDSYLRRRAREGFSSSSFSAEKQLETDLLAIRGLTLTCKEGGNKPACSSALGAYYSRYEQDNNDISLMLPLMVSAQLTLGAYDYVDSLLADASEKELNKASATIESRDLFFIISPAHTLEKIARVNGRYLNAMSSRAVYYTHDNKIRNAWTDVAEILAEHGAPSKSGKESVSTVSDYDKKRALGILKKYSVDKCYVNQMWGAPGEGDYVKCAGIAPFLHGALLSGATAGAQNAGNTVYNEQQIGGRYVTREEAERFDSKQAAARVSLQNYLSGKNMTAEEALALVLVNLGLGDLEAEQEQYIDSSLDKKYGAKIKDFYGDYAVVDAQRFADKQRRDQRYTAWLTAAWGIEVVWLALGAAFLVNLAVSGGTSLWRGLYQSFNMAKAQKAAHSAKFLSTFARAAGSNSKAWAMRTFSNIPVMEAPVLVTEWQAAGQTQRLATSIADGRFAFDAAKTGGTQADALNALNSAKDYAAQLAWVERNNAALEAAGFGERWVMDGAGGARKILPETSSPGGVLHQTADGRWFKSVNGKEVEVVAVKPESTYTVPSKYLKMRAAQERQSALEQEAQITDWINDTQRLLGKTYQPTRWQQAAYGGKNPWNEYNSLTNFQKALSKLELQARMAEGVIKETASALTKPKTWLAGALGSVPAAGANVQISFAPIVAQEASLGVNNLVKIQNTFNLLSELGRGASVSVESGRIITAPNTAAASLSAARGAVMATGYINALLATPAITGRRPEDSFVSGSKNENTSLPFLQYFAGVKETRAPSGGFAQMNALYNAEYRPLLYADTAAEILSIQSAAAQEGRRINSAEQDRINYLKEDIRRNNQDWTKDAQSGAYVPAVSSTAREILAYVDEKSAEIDAQLTAREIKDVYAGADARGRALSSGEQRAVVNALDNLPLKIYGSLNKELQRDYPALYAVTRAEIKKNREGFLSNKGKAYSRVIDGVFTHENVAARPAPAVASVTLFPGAQNIINAVINRDKISVQDAAYLTDVVQKVNDKIDALNGVTDQGITKKMFVAAVREILADSGLNLNRRARIMTHLEQGIEDAEAVLLRGLLNEANENEAFVMADGVMSSIASYSAGPKISAAETDRMTRQLNTADRALDKDFRRDNFVSDFELRASRQRKTAPVKPDGTPYNVLFVNDDKWVIMDTKLGGKKSAFVYDATTSVSFAKELLRNNPGKYDFVLIDVYFENGGNGFDVAEIITQMPAEQRPVLIAISAESNEGNMPEKLYQKGFSGAYARGKRPDSYLGWLINKGYKGAGYGNIAESKLDFSDSKQLIEEVFDPQYRHSDITASPAWVKKNLPVIITGALAAGAAVAGIFGGAESGLFTLAALPFIGVLGKRNDGEPVYRLRESGVEDVKELTRYAFSLSEDKNTVSVTREGYEGELQVPVIRGVAAEYPSRSTFLSRFRSGRYFYKVRRTDGKNGVRHARVAYNPFYRNHILLNISEFDDADILKAVLNNIGKVGSAAVFAENTYDIHSLSEGNLQGKKNRGVSEYDYYIAAVEDPQKKFVKMVLLTYERTARSPFLELYKLSAAGQIMLEENRSLPKPEEEYIESMHFFYDNAAKDLVFLVNGREMPMHTITNVPVSVPAEKVKEALVLPESGYSFSFSMQGVGGKINKAHLVRVSNPFKRLLGKALGEELSHKMSGVAANLDVLLPKAKYMGWKEAFDGTSFSATEHHYFSLKDGDKIAIYAVLTGLSFDGKTRKILNITFITSKLPSEYPSLAEFRLAEAERERSRAASAAGKAQKAAEGPGYEPGYTITHDAARGEVTVSMYEAQNMTLPVIPYTPAKIASKTLFFSALDGIFAGGKEFGLTDPGGNAAVARASSKNLFLPKLKKRLNNSGAEDWVVASEMESMLPQARYAGKTHASESTGYKFYENYLFATPSEKSGAAVYVVRVGVKENGDRELAALFRRTAKDTASGAPSRRTQARGFIKDNLVVIILAAGTALTAGVAALTVGAAEGALILAGAPLIGIFKYSGPNKGPSLDTKYKIKHNKNDNTAELTSGNLSVTLPVVPYEQLPFADRATIYQILSNTLPGKEFVFPGPDGNRVRAVVAYDTELLDEVSQRYGTTLGVWKALAGLEAQLKKARYIGWNKARPETGFDYYESYAFAVSDASKGAVVNIVRVGVSLDRFGEAEREIESFLRIFNDKGGPKRGSRYLPGSGIAYSSIFPFMAFTDGIKALRRVLSRHTGLRPVRQAAFAKDVYEVADDKGASHYFTYISPAAARHLRRAGRLEKDGIFTTEGLTLDLHFASVTAEGDYFFSGGEQVEAGVFMREKLPGKNGVLFSSDLPEGVSLEQFLSGAVMNAENNFIAEEEWTALESVLNKLHDNKILYGNAGEDILLSRSGEGVLRVSFLPSRNAGTPFTPAAAAAEKEALLRAADGLRGKTLLVDKPLPWEADLYLSSATVFEEHAPLYNEYLSKKAEINEIISASREHAQNVVEKLENFRFNNAGKFSFSGFARRLNASWNRKEDKFNEQRFESIFRESLGRNIKESESLSQELKDALLEKIPAAEIPYGKDLFVENVFEGDFSAAARLQRAALSYLNESATGEVLLPVNVTSEKGFLPENTRFKIRDGRLLKADDGGRLAQVERFFVEIAKTSAVNFLDTMEGIESPVKLRLLQETKRPATTKGIAVQEFDVYTDVRGAAAKGVKLHVDASLGVPEDARVVIQRDGTLAYYIKDNFGRFYDMPHRVIENNFYYRMPKEELGRAADHLFARMKDGAQLNRVDIVVRESVNKIWPLLLSAGLAISSSAVAGVFGKALGLTDLQTMLIPTINYGMGLLAIVVGGVDKVFGKAFLLKTSIAISTVTFTVLSLAGFHGNVNLLFESGVINKIILFGAMSAIGVSNIFKTMSISALLMQNSPSKEVARVRNTQSTNIKTFSYFLAGLVPALANFISVYAFNGGNADAAHTFDFSLIIPVMALLGAAEFIYYKRARVVDMDRDFDMLKLRRSEKIKRVARETASSAKNLAKAWSAKIGATKLLVAGIMFTAFEIGVGSRFSTLMIAGARQEAPGVISFIQNFAITENATAFFITATALSVGAFLSRGVVIKRLASGSWNSSDGLLASVLISVTGFGMFLAAGISLPGIIGIFVANAGAVLWYSQWFNLHAEQAKAKGVFGAFNTLSAFTIIGGAAPVIMALMPKPDPLALIDLYIPLTALVTAAVLEGPNLAKSKLFNVIRKQYHRNLKEINAQVLVSSLGKSIKQEELAAPRPPETTAETAEEDVKMFTSITEDDGTITVINNFKGTTTVLTPADLLTVDYMGEEEFLRDYIRPVSGAVVEMANKGRGPPVSVVIAEDSRHINYLMEVLRRQPPGDMHVFIRSILADLPGLLPHAVFEGETYKVARTDFLGQPFKKKVSSYKFYLLALRASNGTVSLFQITLEERIGEENLFLHRIINLRNIRSDTALTLPQREPNATPQYTYEAVYDSSRHALAVTLADATEELLPVISLKELPDFTQKKIYDEILPGLRGDLLSFTLPGGEVVPAAFTYGDKFETSVLSILQNKKYDQSGLNKVIGNIKHFISGAKFLGYTMADGAPNISHTEDYGFASEELPGMVSFYIVRVNARFNGQREVVGIKKIFQKSRVTLGGEKPSLEIRPEEGVNFRVSDFAYYSPELNAVVEKVSPSRTIYVPVIKVRSQPFSVVPPDGVPGPDLPQVLVLAASGGVESLYKIPASSKLRVSVEPFLKEETASGKDHEQAVGELVENLSRAVYLGFDDTGEVVSDTYSHKEYFAFAFEDDNGNIGYYKLPAYAYRDSGEKVLGGVFRVFLSEKKALAARARGANKDAPASNLGKENLLFALLLAGAAAVFALTGEPSAVLAAAVLPLASTKELRNLIAQHVRFKLGKLDLQIDHGERVAEEKRAALQETFGLSAAKLNKQFNSVSAALKSADIKENVRALAENNLRKARHYLDYKFDYSGLKRAEALIQSAENALTTDKFLLFIEGEDSSFGAEELNVFTNSGYAAEVVGDNEIGMRAQNLAESVYYSNLGDVKELLVYVNMHGSLGEKFLLNLRRDQGINLASLLYSLQALRKEKNIEKIVLFLPNCFSGEAMHEFISLDEKKREGIDLITASGRNGVFVYHATAFHPFVILPQGLSVREEVVERIRYAYTQQNAEGLLGFQFYFDGVLTDPLKSAVESSLLFKKSPFEGVPLVRLQEELAAAYSLLRESRFNKENSIKNFNFPSSFEVMVPQDVKEIFVFKNNFFNLEQEGEVFVQLPQYINKYVSGEFQKLLPPKGKIQFLASPVTEKGFWNERVKREFSADGVVKKILLPALLAVTATGLIAAASGFSDVFAGVSAAAVIPASFMSGSSSYSQSSPGGGQELLTALKSGYIPPGKTLAKINALPSKKRKEALRMYNIIQEMSSYRLRTDFEVAPGEEDKINLVNWADSHGYFFPRLGLDKTDPLRVRGGFAVFASFINSLRAAGKQVIVFGNGDDLGGITWHPDLEKAQGRNAALIINSLGIDAYIPGNHEFDYGAEVFEKNMLALNAPVLAMNLRYKNGAKPSYVQPYTIVEKSGRKIALVGFTRIKGNAEKYFKTVDMHEAFAEYVDEILAHNPAAIVVGAHYSAEAGGNSRFKTFVDTYVGMLRQRGIELIITGGHSHRVVAREEGGVYFSQAGFNMESVNLIRMDFTKSPGRGDVIVSRVKLWQDVFSQDRVIGRYVSMIAELKNSKKIGSVPRLQKYTKNSAHLDSEIGNWIADTLYDYSMYESTENKINKAFPSAHKLPRAGIVTIWDIRAAQMREGAFTEGDMAELYPLQERVGIGVVRVRDLKKLILKELQSGFSSVMLSRNVKAVIDKENNSAEITIDNKVMQDDDKIILFGRPRTLKRAGGFSPVQKGLPKISHLLSLSIMRKRVPKQSGRITLKAKINGSKVNGSKFTPGSLRREEPAAGQGALPAASSFSPDAAKMHRRYIEAGIRNRKVQNQALTLGQSEMFDDKTSVYSGGWAVINRILDEASSSRVLIIGEHHGDDALDLFNRYLADAARARGYLSATEFLDSGEHGLFSTAYSRNFHLGSTQYFVGLDSPGYRSSSVYFDGSILSKYRINIAQGTRSGVMAQNLLGILERYPDKKVIVFVGHGHSNTKSADSMTNILRSGGHSVFNVKLYGGERPKTYISADIIDEKGEYVITKAAGSAEYYLFTDLRFNAPYGAGRSGNISKIFGFDVLLNVPNPGSLFNARVPSYSFRAEEDAFILPPVLIPAEAPYIEPAAAPLADPWVEYDHSFRPLRPLRAPLRIIETEKDVHSS